MSIARHRLDVLLLPQHPEDAAWADLAVGRLDEAGLWPDGVIEGGTARVQRGPSERFLSNRQGGFRVECPTGGHNVAAAFGSALEAWRRGGPRALVCVCGSAHDLATLAFAPPAGFASAWIEVEDTAAAELTPAAAAHLGPHRRVWRRG